MSYHCLWFRFSFLEHRRLPLLPPLPQLQDVEQIVHRLQLQPPASVHLTEQRQRKVFKMPQNPEELKAGFREYPAGIENVP